MTNELTLFVIIGILVFFVWSIRREFRTNRKRVNEVFIEAFVARESLTLDEFYNRYFLSLGIAPEVVFGVRNILEEQLDADMSRLCAEDDFSKNLSFFWDFDSMADVEIVLALEEHFKIKITDSEAEEAHTVSEIVQLVAAKVEKLHTP